ncbi:MAG: alpha-N-acetylglucosaminidase [Bacteroides sp.]|nr:alpha-N-acetylglucosaminidase [Bacteroides sp.]
MVTLDMLRMRIAWFCAVSLALLQLCSCGTDDPGRCLKSEYSPSEQQQAAKALVKRVTGVHAREFEVIVTPLQKDGRDWFAYYASPDGRIVLEGNDGVSVASALHSYLRTWCGWHDSWCGKNTSLPAELPLPQGRVEKSSPYRYRYNLNYCTFNYSLSWWDRERWQEEIDFMAMNGINMPLALTGQNTVWQQVYRELGFTDEELADFFSGPAFFNWFWMGNLDGWGGPLPQSFIDAHEELQRFILGRERSLGMNPVLPAFTGHVPPSFSSRFPDVKVNRTTWLDYPEVTILDPSEEMFSKIAEMFIRRQTEIYGTNHFYSADTFNENLPPSDDPGYLAAMSKVVYDGMAAADPEAVWLMQAWLFYHQADFWRDAQIEALLGAVPDDRMIVLDLFADMKPVWKRAKAFYGKPWIWCMLQNFGQRQCLCGSSEAVSGEPDALLHNPDAGNMQGIGLTMEGIGQNPFIFALMFENIWQDGPVDREEFLGDYIRCRYGVPESSADSACVRRSWESLLHSVYSNDSDPDGGRQSVMTGRPVFAGSADSLAMPHNFFSLDSLLSAWDGMIACADGFTRSDGFRYDLVDVTRQCLLELLDMMHHNSQKCYYGSDAEGFAQYADNVLELADDVDCLLATRREFLLGPWVEGAKSYGNDESERNLYEWNAKTQVTLWGVPGSGLNDYACKNWSGLVKDFYRRRLELFYAGQRSALSDVRSFDYEAFVAECLDFEKAWTEGHDIYPVEPSGDEIEACRRFYGKWRENF